MLSHFKEKSPFCSYTIVTRSNFEKPNRKTLRSHCSPADRLKSRIKSIHTIVVSDVREKKNSDLHCFSCSSTELIIFNIITKLCLDFQILPMESVAYLDAKRNFNMLYILVLEVFFNFVIQRRPKDSIRKIS